MTKLEKETQAKAPEMQAHRKIEDRRIEEETIIPMDDEEYYAQIWGDI
jgi:hypothetical protein